MGRRNQSDTEQLINKFLAVCRQLNLPITPQKRAIYEELASTTSHPTAGDLYTELKKKFPKMSFATVYKNLNKFCELGLAIGLESTDGSAHYDAETKTHHHTISLSTGKVSDVIVTGRIPIPKNLTPHNIKRISVTYYIK